MPSPWSARICSYFHHLISPELRREILAVLVGMLVSAMSLAAAGPGSYPGSQEGGSGWTMSGSVVAKNPDEKPRLDVQDGFYRLATLNGDVLQSTLKSLPKAGSSLLTKSGTVISLPMPNGVFSRFYVEESSVMEAGLAAQYPQFQTYRGRGIDDPEATLRCDLTPEGFHGQVLSSLGTVYIDPYRAGDSTVYISYDKQGLQRSSAFTCLVDETILATSANQMLGRAVGRSASSDGIQRTYRLALACTGEYAAAVCGHNGVAVTVANTLSAMVTSIARINGVFERDLGIHLNLVANNASLIYLDSSTDPYTNSDGNTLIDQNQTVCDATIGSANYDIGHVFSTGGGGLAYRGAVCGAYKAGGVTGSSSPYGDGYDIDYVAHEMGHQFGANHTFIAESGSCGGGNRNSTTAYELGSGITIMAYAGICSPDNLDAHSYDYFHTISLDEITTFIAGLSCSQNIASGNDLPVLGIGPNYTDVPVNTPFVLTALSATDADGDSLTYCWDDWQTLTNCLFRPQPLSANPSRTFPKISDLLSGAAHPWETLPTVPGTRTFRCTVRDNHLGAGAFVSDTLTVTFVAGAFSVSAPNTAVSWTGGSNQTVTWIKGGSTSANVKISLSTDGGLTWNVLVASTPNDGSEQLTIPNTPSATCRIKVEPTDNIYFALSTVDFRIVAGTNTLPTISSIANQSLAQHVSSAAIPFTVGDLETTPASLSVSATSTNTTLLPVSNIVLGGTGANRTVTLTTAANQTGSATVEITVQDADGGTASQSFTVDVSNRAPIALAHDITITAPTQAVDASNASVDNGSNDPDGNSITLSQIPAGPYAAGTTPVTLTVTDSLGSTAQATANITITAAPVLVSLTSSGTAPRGESVTLVAHASSLFGTPTGTVTFLEGTTSLGTASLINGVATLLTSDLSVGDHTLSARYEATTNWASGTSTSLTQHVSPATIVASKSTSALTLSAGSSGMVELTISQSGVLSGPVNLTATGMPQGVICTFSRNGLPVAELPATIQVTVTTQGSGLRASNRPFQGLGGGAFLVCGFLLVPFSRRKKHGMLFLSGLLAVMLGGLLACGGHSHGSSNHTQTPEGTYAITITATASQADPVTTTLQLTVTR